MGNLSVRGNVFTGDDVLIDGLILQGANSKTVVFRALGPSLSAVGVPGALQDPTLELRDSNGAVLQANDNWQDAPNKSEIQAAGLAPTDLRESAVLLSLPAGNYTTIVRGANGSMGIALSEAYRLP
jgi:hypothetical protein